jgi:3,4-dihydroxy 2-butanone 4-phosphate synthase/GTP cyclohydrolase II
LTNNPAKLRGLDGHGLVITERVPLHVDIHPEARRYIDTKRDRMGHHFPDDATSTEPTLITMEQR